MPALDQNSPEPERGNTITVAARASLGKLAPYPITATAWLVLAVALVATAISWYLSHEQVEAHGQERFDALTQRTRDAILKQMFDYEQVLRSGVALFSADPELKRQQWHNFAESRQLERFFPAIQSLGFVAWLRGEEKSALELKIRADGVSEFTVYPEGIRDKHAPLILLEPNDARHRHGLGSDLLTSSVLRAALETARDTGEAALSAKLPVDPDTVNASAEALVALILPVYQTGAKPGTIAERQDSLIGFVYANLRVAELLRDAIVHDTDAQIELKIFASDSRDRAALLFDKDALLFGEPNESAPKYSATTTLSVAGQTWQLLFASTSAFDAATTSPQPWRLAMGGILIDAFLFAVVVALSTQRERAMLHAKEIAESANRSKSEFLANISHELRTPLTAILGFSQLLKHDPMLANQHLAFASKIHKAGEHLLNLVNDLLDLARIEAGQLTVSLEPVALISVFAECRALMQPLADQKGVALSIANDNVAGTAAVIADRVRLRQILINLLSNAIKYNREGGSVSLTCERNHNEIALHVSDTGLGLDKEQLTRIFQPFNRLGQELSPIEGTGIGLVITKRLVEKMRGKIAVASTKGKGSRFSVTLPAVALLPDVSGAQTKRELAPELHTKASRGCVLYIEDNPANLELIGSLLTLNWPQLTYLSAASAETGLQLAAAHQPDVILLDINLPDMNGFAVMERLKRMTATSSIPVVAATANASDADIERGKEIGFADYLTKPFDLNRLLVTVDRLLSEQLRARAQDITTTASATTSLTGAAIEFPRVLDNNMTRQLESTLGSRAIPFIDKLLDDVPKRLAALQDAEANQDIKRLRAELHTLKGNSSNAGAGSIVELCSRVSRACQDERPAQVRELLGKLRSEYENRVQPALLQFRRHLADQDQRTH